MCSRAFSLKTENKWAWRGWLSEVSWNCIEFLLRWQLGMEAALICQDWPLSLACWWFLIWPKPSYVSGTQASRLLFRLRSLPYCDLNGDRFILSPWEECLLWFIAFSLPWSSLCICLNHPTDDVCNVLNDAILKIPSCTFFQYPSKPPKNRKLTSPHVSTTLVKMIQVNNLNQELKAFLRRIIP